jgi:thioredoxin 1
MLEELNETVFGDLVLKSGKPVVVEVYTSTCPNCKALDPIFEETAKENKALADFYRLSADNYLQLAKKHKVLGVPTLLYFSHGVLVDRKAGVSSKRSILKRLRPILDYTRGKAENNVLKGWIRWPFRKM